MHIMWNIIPHNHQKKSNTTKLENIMLNEINQTQKDKYYILSLISGHRKVDLQTSIVAQ